MQSNYLEIRDLEFFTSNVEGYWDNHHDDIVDYTIILNQSDIQDHKIVLGRSSDIIDHKMKL